VANRRHVPLPGGIFGVEVRDGPIVPEVEVVLGQLHLGDVSDEPRHCLGARAGGTS
jgi:hypothetical protein